MRKQDIQTFIEEMDDMGDKWTEEQVEEVYGNKSLDEALDSRRSEVNMHLNNIANAFLGTLNNKK